MIYRPTIFYTSALLLATLLIFSCSNEQKGKNGKTVVKIAERTYAFGTIKQTDSIKHNFTIRNSGDVPLSIGSVVVSCGCTTPKWPKKPIEPGKTAIISVTFKPGTTNSGHVNKSIIVKANTPEIFHVFYLDGNVII